MYDGNKFVSEFEFHKALIKGILHIALSGKVPPQQSRTSS